MSHFVFSSLGVFGTLGAWRKYMISNVNTERLPVLFIGHGSPMNAIETNNFSRMLNNLGQKIPTPKSILMVSAHWESEGTWVLGMDKPKTIHDFYGFPQELFDIQYPAPGSSETAKIIQNTIIDPKIHNDLNRWGFDHGSWSVLRHLYPLPNIPVTQISIDMSRPTEYHFKIGQQLSQLRNQGVLIIGSGNLVHNLGRINWDTYAKAHEWAIEFDQWTEKKLEERDFTALNNDFHKTEAGKLSVPTMDHYLPLQYILGASDSKDELHFEFEEIQNASISMRTFGFWPKG